MARFSHPSTVCRCTVLLLWTALITPPSLADSARSNYQRFISPPPVQLTSLVNRNRDQNQYYRGRINTSLYRSAREIGMPESVINQVIRIFKNQVNFRKIQRGDRFEVLVQKHYVGDSRRASQTVLAAKLTVGKKTHQAFLYRKANGKSDYYTPSGRSLTATGGGFLRKPVRNARISSHFNPKRLHPIHKTVRPHRGTDFAARRGTPIMAAANGTVSFVGRKGGFGRTVMIRHSKKYTTLYAHMSRYAKRMRNGQSVRKGQIIGYIGSTGTATGPHLHYELRVNGKCRNPMTYPLPKGGQQLTRQQLADFRNQTRPIRQELAAFGRLKLNQLAQH